MWRCFWFGIVVGVASMIFLNDGWHRHTSTAVFVWSVTAWIPLSLPDLIVWIAKLFRRHHRESAA